jgi:hypothetical protein
MSAVIGKERTEFRGKPRFVYVVDQIESLNEKVAQMKTKIGKDEYKCQHDEASSCDTRPTRSLRTRKGLGSRQIRLQE